MNSPALGQGPYGEVVEVRTGFARVTVADAQDRPRADDFVVSWKGTKQEVREVLGGPGSAIEIGIALDLSASMHESLDAMRSAVGDLLRSELSAADRVFVVSVSDRSELVAEGRDASLGAIETLASDLRPGLRPTKFFEGLESALSSFRNSSPRAVLLVASDGCDSLQKAHAGELLLERAADLAIPIVLVAPDRRECRNTICKPTEAGTWSCTEALSPPTVRVRDRDPFNPNRSPLELPADSLTSRVTATRDRFVQRLEAGAGDFLVARSDAQWREGIDSVRGLLDRQWTVVFEPSSEKVRSSEVRVKVRKGARPTASGDRSVEARQEAPPAVEAPPVRSVTELITGKPPVVHEQIAVEVVSVDLVATDRRGRRILDLAREELRLEVDGKARLLEYFSAPAGSAPESRESIETSPAAEPARGGTVFLVFDRMTLETRDLQRVIDGFEGLVSSSSFTGKTFVVASFAGAPRLHARETSDPDEVRRALDEVARAGAQGTLRRLERRHLEDEVRGAMKLSVDLLAAQILALEDQEVSQQAAFVAMLQDLVATSASVNEPNTLLIATEGFSAEPGRYLRDLLKDSSKDRAGTLLSWQDAAASRNVFLLAEVEKLAKTFQERRVTAYTLIPSYGSFGADAALRMPATSAAREDLYFSESAANVAKLADWTGGSRIPIFTDLDERMDAIRLDGQARYSIGFTTGPPAGFESHRIRIETTRPDTVLRYRTSYRRLSPAEQWQSALAAAARAGIVNAALPIELRVGSGADRPSGQGATRRVPVLLDIPIAHLTLEPSPDLDSRVAVLTVQLAVHNAAGKLVLGAEEAIEISVPTAELERAREDTWTHRVEVDLAEGGAGVGALVIEKNTGAWATASCTIPAVD